MQSKGKSGCEVRQVVTIFKVDKFTAGTCYNITPSEPFPATVRQSNLIAPGNLPLVFRTLSSVDTTLIINGPDGSWSCDDDSYGDLDAEVRFNRPQGGTYDVWVGTFGGSTAAATLLITETP